ncbi:MAG: ParA family protein [Lachnospiraceae bacterium]|jgi:chromosome partitioning protein|nr:MAG: ParA family protein [Lachnospiraceae bacterium]
MGRIIAIANQKGGVGKTTTAINLAAALAEAGQRVLGIDFDPQGNLSSGIGIEKESIKNSVYDLLINGVDFYSVLQETEIKNLDVLPTNVNLAGAEIELQDEANRDTKLKEKIEAIRANYDFIIVDCPPSLSLLTINALTAADSVLIPIQCEYYALEGLGQMVKTINLIRKKLNKKLTIEGVVFTMYDARTNLSQQVVESVKETLDEYIYNAVIPRNVRLAEAPSYGKPITEYDTRSSGAESYRMLAAEVISRN